MLRSQFIVRAVGSRVTIHPVHHKLVTIPGLRPCLFTRYARKLSNEETIGYKFIPSGEFARLSIPRVLSSYHRSTIIIYACKSNRSNVATTTLISLVEHCSFHDMVPARLFKDAFAFHACWKISTLLAFQLLANVQ